MSFFKIETVFTELPDFHKLVLSVFKLHFQRRRLKRYHTEILEVLNRIILIGIFKIDFQQNLQKNTPLLKKFS